PQVQSFQHDAMGYPVQRFEGDARPTHRQAFDAQGRLLWHASALGLLHTRQYDSEGQLLRSAMRSASMERATSWNYDEFGREVGAPARTHPPPRPLQFL